MLNGELLDYVLFHQIPFSKFVEYLNTAKIPMKTSHSDGVYTISISVDIDDEIADSIETRYDELLDMSRELLANETPQGKGNFSIATVVVDLASGETSNAHIRPDLLYRIMNVIDENELGEFVRAIAEAVENPDDRSFCQKVRNDDIDFNKEET